MSEHPDDLAVDRFAAAMKTKLAQKRKDGRGGWEDKAQCSADFLSQLLRDHVEKGDPLDVGNLSMMLHQRGERITEDVASTVQVWQDISTAPKDGTAILAFNCRHMMHAPVVVVWKTDPDVEIVGDEPHWADAATVLGTALYYNGNFFSHWMPLPVLRAISGDTSNG